MLPFAEALRQVRKEPPLSSDFYTPASLAAEDTGEAMGPDPSGRLPELYPYGRGSLYPDDRDPRRLRTR